MIKLLVPDDKLKYKVIQATPKKMVDHGNGEYSEFGDCEIKEGDFVKVMYVLVTDG